MEKAYQTGALRIAFYLNAAIITLGFLFGFRYLLGSQLLPYHLAAMSLSGWGDVYPAHQFMLLAFMRIAGVGMTTASIAMSFILFKSFAKGENWSRWGLLCICLAHYIPITVNMIILKIRTPANPPLAVGLIGVGIAIAAFGLSSEMKPKQNKI